MNEYKKSVAILGAGITGLTAAFKLQQSGANVSVFETSNRVGGVIETVREEGFLVECGPNSILDTSPKIGELLGELDFSDQRLNANANAKNRYIVRDAKPIALPSSAKAFFKTPAFSFKAKLRLMMEPLIKSYSSENESLADFVIRRLGQEFLDYAINPFVSGVYAGDPEKLSVARAFPKLYALEDEYGSLMKGAMLGAKKRKESGEVSKKDARMFTFKDGMESLPKHLHNKLGDAVRLKTSVESIEKINDAWNINGESFDSVIIAIPAHAITKLKLPADLSCFSDIYYPPVASFSMGFRKDQFEHPLDGFGMLIPQVEKRYALGALFTSSIFAERAPDDLVLLTAFVGGSCAPEKALQPIDEILQNILADYQALLGLSGEPVYKHVSVYEKAIPQYNVGYERFLNKMDETEKEHSGLFFAGHYRNGISVSDSILSGIHISERILNN